MHSAGVPDPGGWQRHAEAGVGRALQLLGDRPRIIGKFRQFCEGTNVHPLKRQESFKALGSRLTSKLQTEVVWGQGAGGQKPPLGA